MLAVFGSACMQTTAKTMESWVGHQDTELVSKWGAPVRTATLTNGSKVMTWEKLWTDQGGTRQICEESFTLSPAGVVLTWSANNCPRW